MYAEYCIVSTPCTQEYRITTSRAHLFSNWHPGFTMMHLGSFIIIVAVGATTKCFVPVIGRAASCAAAEPAAPTSATPLPPDGFVTLNALCGIATDSADVGILVIVTGSRSVTVALSRAALVGVFVGTNDGEMVGLTVGIAVRLVGGSVGTMDGVLVGLKLGVSVGEGVGTTDGVVVGVFVGRGCNTGPAGSSQRGSD
jgi:hypothetical protein